MSGIRYTLEDFIKISKQKHKDKYDYSSVDYINSTTKVIIICPIHGNFLQTPKNHFKGNGCQKCCKNYKCTTNDFITKAKEVHGDKYNYSKVNYVNSSIKVIIICPIHGEFMQAPYSHLSGRNCVLCSKGRKNKYNTDDFIEKSKLKHGNKYDYSKTNYINCHINVNIICRIHGIFLQNPRNHIQGSGCPRCSKSKMYSNKQIQWLNFISEYYNITIRHAENGGEFVLPNTNNSVDGYCEETNTIYEFNGDLWHGNPDIYDYDYTTFMGVTSGYLYEKTKIKEELIRKMGYKLIVMWENDWKNINKQISILQLKIRGIF